MKWDNGGKQWKKMHFNHPKPYHLNAYCIINHLQPFPFSLTVHAIWQWPCREGAEVQ